MAKSSRTSTANSSVEWDKSYTISKGLTTLKSGGSSSKSSGSGGGGGGSSAADKARKAADEAAEKARDLAKDAAKRLNKQIDAVKITLGSEGFIKALNTKLSAIDLSQRQQDEALVTTWRDAIAGLNKSRKDNEKASGDQTFGALENKGRELVSAISSALSMGAGESDVLRSRVMALRNWGQNQGEINRSYFDTLTSLNNSRNDVNADTRTARLNVETQANADRGSAWTDYINQMSAAQTQLGNLLGQQAEYYNQAEEDDDADDSGDASGKAFKEAAKFASMTYQNPGNSRALLDWKGEKEFEKVGNTGMYINQATSIRDQRKPQGAGLRTWRT